jgi:hypothetical protein
MVATMIATMIAGVRLAMGIGVTALGTTSIAEITCDRSRATWRCARPILERASAPTIQIRTRTVTGLEGRCVAPCAYTRRIYGNY